MRFQESGDTRSDSHVRMLHLLKPKCLQPIYLSSQKSTVSSSENQWVFRFSGDTGKTSFRVGEHKNRKGHSDQGCARAS